MSKICISVGTARDESFAVLQRNLVLLCTICAPIVLSFVCLFFSFGKEIEVSENNALQVTVTLELFFFALVTVNYRFNFLQFNFKDNNLISKFVHIIEGSGENLEIQKISKIQGLFFSVRSLQLTVTIAHACNTHAWSV